MDPLVRRLWPSLAMLAGFIPPVHASVPPPSEDRVEVRAAIEALAFLEGEWSGTRVAYDRAGMPVQEMIEVRRIGRSPDGYTLFVCHVRALRSNDEGNRALTFDDFAIVSFDAEEERYELFAPGFLNSYTQTPGQIYLHLVRRASPTSIVWTVEQPPSEPRRRYTIERSGEDLRVKLEVLVEGDFRVSTQSILRRVEAVDIPYCPIDQTVAEANAP